MASRGAGLDLKRLRCQTGQVAQSDGQEEEEEEEGVKEDVVDSVTGNTEEGASDAMPNAGSQMGFDETSQDSETVEVADGGGHTQSFTMT